MDVAQWIDINREEIYVTFRELMSLFEKKIFKNYILFVNYDLIYNNWQ